MLTVNIGNFNNTLTYVQYNIKKNNLKLILIIKLCIIFVCRFSL